MIKKTSKLLFISLFLLTTGCWDYVSMESTYYIYSIGIDYQDKNYILYAQITNLSMLAASTEGSGGAEQDKSWTGSAKGPNLLAAFNQLQSTLENNIEWGHLNSIVFTDRGLQHGMKDLFDLLTHYRRARLNQWVFATDQPVEKIFESVPIIFQTPYYSLLGNPEYYYTHSSYIKPIRTFQVLRAQHEKGNTILIPKINLKHVWKGTEKKEISNLTIDGIFPTTHFQATKSFPLSKLLGLRWMQKDARNTKLYLQQNGQEAVQLICYHPSVDIEPQLVQHQAKFKIKTKPKCEIQQMNFPLTEQEITKLAKQKIEQQIRTTYTHGLNQHEDLYSLSYYFYHKYPRQWDQLSKNNQLPLTKDSLYSVIVEPKIESGGTRKIKDHSKE